MFEVNTISKKINTNKFYDKLLLNLLNKIFKCNTFCKIIVYLNSWIMTHFKVMCNILREYRIERRFLKGSHYYYFSTNLTQLI